MTFNKIFYTNTCMHKTIYTDQCKLMDIQYMRDVQGNILNIQIFIVAEAISSLRV